MALYFIHRRFIKLLLVACIMCLIVLSTRFQTLSDAVFRKSRLSEVAKMESYIGRKSQLAFDHIYVLTVGTEREKYFQPMLDYLNAEYEVFQGALDSDPGMRNKLNTVLAWRNSTENKAKVRDISESDLVGKVGCTLGHRAMWQDMVDKGYSTAIFLEDDVDININFESIIADALENIPEDWDAIYPGHCGSFWVATNNNTVPQDGQAWHQLSRASCTHSYILKRETAQSLLAMEHFKEPELMQTPLDVHLAHLISGGVLPKVYGFSPVIVIQRPRAFDQPSLVSHGDISLERPRGDGVERGWRYRDRIPKNESAAYLAGVSYWHDLA